MTVNVYGLPDDVTEARASFRTRLMAEFFFLFFPVGVRFSFFVAGPFLLGVWVDENGCVLFV